MQIQPNAGAPRSNAGTPQAHGRRAGVLPPHIS